MNFNRIIFAGRMTRDPQLKFLPSQTAVCEFGLVCNRKFKVGNEQREEMTFIDCTAFGRTAEVINQYMTKGKPILIEGRIKYDSWEDKQSGAKRSKLSIVVENFQFLGGGGDGDDKPRQQASRPIGTRPQSHSGKVADAIGDEPVFDDADIPF
jgi:single-strand DNA-binding protein